MKYRTFLKRAGIILVLALLGGLCGLAYLYFSLCGGHPHGMC